MLPTGKVHDAVPRFRKLKKNMYVILSVHEVYALTLGKTYNA
jgi:hypothetical protein